MLELDIYTDASGNINTKEEKGFGIGGTWHFNGNEYWFSEKVTQSQLQNILGTNEKISNPTAELFAVAYVLQSFYDSIDFLPALSITIYSDYIGVKNWMCGNWEINKNYISELVLLSRKYINHIQKQGSSVAIKWVKGHDGNIHNERADYLAKARSDESNINQFFEIFNK